MPTKTVANLIEEVKEIKQDLTKHLIESGGIRARLDMNTWLTGIVLVALIGQWITQYFKR